MASTRLPMDESQPVSRTAEKAMSPDSAAPPIGCVRSVRPVQIVEVRERPLIPSYSWCESWTTGYDSIYSLLSKFALLNGLTAREMANLFVSPECGRKSIL